MKLTKLRSLLLVAVIFVIVLPFSIHQLTNHYLAELTFKHTTSLSASLLKQLNSEGFSVRG